LENRDVILPPLLTLGSTWLAALLPLELASGHVWSHAQGVAEEPSTIKKQAMETNTFRMVRYFSSFLLHVIRPRGSVLFPFSKSYMNHCWGLISPLRYLIER